MNFLPAKKLPDAEWRFGYLHKIWILQRQEWPSPAGLVGASQQWLGSAQQKPFIPCSPPLPAALQQPGRSVTCWAPNTGTASGTNCSVLQNFQPQNPRLVSYSRAEGFIILHCFITYAKQHWRSNSVFFKTVFKGFHQFLLLNSLTIPVSNKTNNSIRTDISAL